MTAAATFVGNYPFSQLGPAGLDLLEPIAAGGDPTVGPGFQRPVGWTVALPDGSAAWVKTSTAPTGWQPIGGGGAFPGFGGAPPTVASASAAGVAGTASRSDHTHGLDLVTYTPSLVGMQAQGVLEQGFGAGTATPTVLTMSANNIPFGIAGGLLSQDDTFIFTNGLANPSTRFGISTVPSTVTAAALPRQLNVIDESGFGSRGSWNSVHRTAAGSTGAAYNLARSAGTFVAPTAVVNDMGIGQVFFLGMNNAATYIAAVSFAAVVDHTAAVGATVPINLEVRIGGGGAVTAANTNTMWTYAGDVVLGAAALATNATQGWLYIRSMPGIPSLLPTVPTYNAGASTVAAIPCVFDSTHFLLWAVLGGAPKFAPFFAGNAVGATAVAITNSPGANATPTSYLQFTSTSGVASYIPVLT